MSKTLIPVLALLVVACADRFTLDPRLAPLAKADLEPGRGLGDAVLGETTLRDFHARYGAGIVSVLFSDDFTAIQLQHGNGQFAFLFPVDHEFAMGNADVMRSATRDLESVIAAHPHVAGARLSSLSVRAGPDPESTHYKGQLPPGVRLGDVAGLALAKLGEPVPGYAPVVAGTTPKDPDTRHVDTDQGVVVYCKRPPPKDDQPRPEVVHRIALYLPR